MRKRNVHIQFWLNRKEAESLDKKVRRSGLSREGKPVTRPLLGYGSQYASSGAHFLLEV